MIMKKIVFVFVALVALIALASCSVDDNNEREREIAFAVDEAKYDAYNEGYNDGYGIGYDNGYEEAKEEYGYDCLCALDIVDQAMAIIDDIEYYSLDDVYDKLIKARDVLSQQHTSYY